MPVGGKGNLEFGADSIDAGDKNRILDAPFLEVRTKESAKTTDAAQHFRAVGGANQGSNA